ncbi:hypothetical protein [Melittangium boletus]|uniref:Lipoprotein n=1 Tax=Melittangium boletus DSM 14713 TaxID=1294270 RepID=A0A250IJB9_9BACT|nr:hypothetical protein [Melittangium boletus]ATB31237.1 hypothetical protein MEBOL_004699 [Melittangium boletus DSM 14713]
MRPPSVLPVCVLLALAACGPPTFVAEVKGETTVPAAPLGGVIPPLDAFPAIASFSGLDFNQNQDFQNQGITKDRVASAKLKSFQLKVLAPADQDFSFLDTLECYARTGDREVLVASRQNIAALGLKAPNPVLSMELTGVELQPFLSAPSMSLSVRGKGRMPPKEVRLQADVKLDVQVRL